MAPECLDGRAGDDVAPSPSSLELRAAFFCDHSIALLAAEEAPRPRLVLPRIGLQPLQGRGGGRVRGPKKVSLLQHFTSLNFRLVP